MTGSIPYPQSSGNVVFGNASAISLLQSPCTKASLFMQARNLSLLSRLQPSQSGTSLVLFIRFSVGRVMRLTTLYVQQWSYEMWWIVVLSPSRLVHHEQAFPS